MTYPHFDRDRLRIRPLRDRANKLRIADMHVLPTAAPRDLSGAQRATIAETAARIRAARAADRPVILAFGAHAIKNGLGPVLINLIEAGHVTHLATNGAGVIHDWEFAFQGESSEDVRENVARGQFGIWEETGRYINLALAVGAWEGRGYGDSVGAMIERDGLLLPDLAQLEPGDGAARDLAAYMQRFSLSPGPLRIPHPAKQYSVQAAAHRLRVPFTSHPMFGHDIIYCHPMSHGAAIGRTAERDFLSFANSVNDLEGGVYLSVGSAVMSPMIFEKSLSMAQNVQLQAGARIENHFMVVVDLADAPWDWQRDGEPPPEHPAYYLRYCKTFNRMGGTMRYLSADNRDFLLLLTQALEVTS